MIASWRSFSTFTAASYSAFPAILFVGGISATLTGSVRWSRWGMALLTDARPEPAALI
ncbi:hypothetical protein [Streptomyces sp. NBC_01431]|uniref:hypothetical protein n=1 Tax=Streptomyces sp. NBC_01431 TaxID=2903863 RepID=UPI002E379BA1|nr:hypothetical protein [Streptomyces sp. NBC_01431]